MLSLVSSQDGDGRYRVDPTGQPLPAVVTEEERIAERNRLIEQSMPEHEKAVVVRVPAAAPRFHAKLPQERWIALLMIFPMFYATYYLSILMVSIGSGAGLMAAGCGVIVLFVVAMAALTIRRFVMRPELTLDEKGLAFLKPGMLSFARKIGLDQLRGFNARVKRRAIDNAESWQLFATLADGSSMLIGSMRKQEDADAIVRGLEETLAQLRLGAGGYRAAF